MDAKGAEELRNRIAQQQQWRLADAVRRGEQPPRDPDAHELEHCGGEVRSYGSDTREELVHGRAVLVTYRLVKRLVDGRWETFEEMERVEPLLQSPAAGARASGLAGRLPR